MAGHDGWKNQPREPKGSETGGQWAKAESAAWNAAGLDGAFYTLNQLQDYYFHRSSPEGEKGILESGVIWKGMDNWGKTPYNGLWFDNSKPFVVFAAPKKLLSDFTHTFTNAVASNIYSELNLRDLRMFLYNPETKTFKELDHGWS